MSLVVFGAGAIGRGLLGELAAQAGWPTVFVEKQPELARQLAAAGHATLCAALAEPAIRRRLEALLAVAAEMLQREYGIAASALREHVDCLVRQRFANTALADRVERVARQPLRKLGPQERLVGLLRRAEKHRLPVMPVCRAMAAALHYDDPRDPESRQLQAWVRADGPGRVLQEICGLHPEEEKVSKGK